MKKIILAYICLLSILLICTSCKNEVNETMYLSINTPNSSLYIKANGKEDKYEVLESKKEDIINFINNANYKYISSEDINGWIYEISYDETTILVGKNLSITTNKERKNYSSKNHQQLVVLLEDIYNK